MSLLSVAHQDAPRSSLAAVALRALASSFIAWRAQRVSATEFEFVLGSRENQEPSPDR